MDNYSYYSMRLEIDRLRKEIEPIKDIGGKSGWWIHKYDLQIKLLILECLNEIANKK